MKSSTKDQTEGTFHEVKGKVKDFVGELSDDPDLEAEGTGEKMAGKVQKKIGRNWQMHSGVLTQEKDIWQLYLLLATDSLC